MKTPGPLQYPYIVSHVKPMLVKCDWLSATKLVESVDTKFVRNFDAVMLFACDSIDSFLLILCQVLSTSLETDNQSLSIVHFVIVS